MDQAILPPLKEVIRQAGLSADKRLGQHFLLDPDILARIAACGRIESGDQVLEIGPGPGGLTRALLNAGACVTAIERDHRCVEILKPLETWAQGRLRVIQGDALKLGLKDLVSGPCKIIANLPYNIGTELLTRWLVDPEYVRSIHVLLQKEVVERLAAPPGNKTYGRLAVLAQLTARVSRQFDLPAAAFHPPPKVVSSLVSLWPRDDAPQRELLRAVEMLTHKAFQQRRKMLRVSLKGLPLSVDELLKDTGIAPDRRPETIEPALFLNMAAKLSKSLR